MYKLIAVCIQLIFIQSTIAQHPTSVNNKAIPRRCNPPPAGDCSLCPARGTPAGFQRKHVLNDNTFNENWNIIKSKQFNSDDAHARRVENAIDFLTNYRLRQTCQRPVGGGPLSRGSSFGTKYPANTFISQDTVNDITGNFQFRNGNYFQNCVVNVAGNQLDCRGTNIKWIQIEYASATPLIYACETDVDYSAKLLPGGTWKLHHLEAPDFNLQAAINCHQG